MNYKKIKTWEDACKVHKVNPKKLPNVKGLPEKFQNWLIATYKMGVIVEAINTDENGKIWTPDWSNTDQIKYQAFFGIKATKRKPSGVGFSYAYYVGWYTATVVGSRLCFETEEKTEHAQKYFKNIFKEIMLM